MHQDSLALWADQPIDIYNVMHRQYGTGKDILVMACKIKGKKERGRVVYAWGNLLRGVGGPFESLSRLHCTVYT